jgi:hypothetical protein
MLQAIKMPGLSWAARMLYQFLMLQGRICALSRGDLLCGIRAGSNTTITVALRELNRAKLIRITHSFGEVNKYEVIDKNGAIFGGNSTKLPQNASMTESVQLDDRKCTTDLTESVQLTRARSTYQPSFLLPTEESKKESKKDHTSYDPTVKKHVIALADQWGFDQFWQLYPRKVGKAAARREYLKVCRSTDPAVIVAGLRRQLDAHAFREDEPQFIPHARTWLSHGRWEDAIDQPPPGAGLTGYAKVYYNLTHQQEAE